jgi:hypothetical protein
MAENFGSWRAAVEAAGLNASFGFTKDYAEMVELYRRCWKENGQAASTKIFENYLRRIGSRYTVNMYSRHFGGLERLAVRIVEHFNSRISDAQLYEKYERKGFIRKPISPSLRHRIFSRDGFKCVRCGRTANEDGVKLAIAHKIAVSKGGTNAEDNLRTLCNDCNLGEGTDHVPDAI